MAAADRMEARAVASIMDAIERGEVDAARWWLSRADLPAAQRNLLHYIPAERWEAVQRRAQELAG